MNTFNIVRRILVASVLLVSFSQITYASAEELSEASKMSAVLTQTMEEGTNESGIETDDNDGLEEEAELLLEDFSEEEHEILINQLSDKELLDAEEEALLKVSTQSMDKIKDNIINDYYENTEAGAKDYAQEIINEMTTNERQALIDELEDKVNLNQEERLLLDTAYKATKKGRVANVAVIALIFVASLALGFYLMAVIST